MASTAANVGGKVLGGFFNLASKGASAIKHGVSSASESLAERSEKSALEAKRKAGEPVDHIVAGISKLVYLLAAGYEKEAHSACKAIAKRVDESSRSTFGDCLRMATVLEGEGAKFGDFTKAVGGDMFSSMMKVVSSEPKDNPDRQEMVEDTGISFLNLIEVAPAQVESVLVAAIAAVYQNPLVQTAPKLLGEAIYVLGYAFQKMGKAGEEAHNKAVAEAQRVMQKEQARAAAAAVLAAPPPAIPGQTPVVAAPAPGPAPA